MNPFNIPPFDLAAPNGQQQTTPANNDNKFRRYTRTPSELLYDMSK